jgi:FMN phosphatase YigB (HAD superfamily)
MGTWLERRKAVFLDLDNTLYDWVAYFAPALRGMCRSLGEMTGVSSNTLFEELKAVFSKHGTVEYSFALQELPSLIAMHPSESGADLAARYRPVIDVFQTRRRAYLRPYPGVRSGIAMLHQAGYKVFGVTDSRQFQAENRLRQLRLDRLLDGLCCVPDHAVPDADTVAAIRRWSADHYKSELQTVIPLPPGLRKPSPGVLDFVVSALKVEYESCIYVGDSLAKDVAMAQQAGVYDCWAEYGARVSPLDFATLVRVTDWTARAVKDALDPSPKRMKIFPSYTATSFDDVVSLALMEPSERPHRHAIPCPPRQLSLLEIGPTLGGV